MNFYFIFPASKGILTQVIVGDLILHAKETSAKPSPNDSVYSVDIDQSQVTMNSNGTYQLGPTYRKDIYPVKIYKNNQGQVVSSTETASFKGTMFHSTKEQPIKSINNDYDDIVRKLDTIRKVINSYSKFCQENKTAHANAAVELRQACDECNSSDATDPELSALISQARQNIVSHLKVILNEEKKLLFLDRLKLLATNFQLISKIILVANEVETEFSGTDPHNPLRNVDVVSLVRTLENDLREISNSNSEALADPDLESVYESLDSFIKENFIQLNQRKNIYSNK